MNLQNRNTVIESIKDELILELGKNIISATIYGSTLCEDFCSTSDFDILLALKKADHASLSSLRIIKEKFFLKGISVDFNIHCLEDLPENRGDAFWHNNRALYFRKEMSLYGRIIIGKNVFPFEKLGTYEFQLEVVRVLNSLLYQTRKCLINKKLDQKNRTQIMKWCIYAVQYALAFKGIYPKTKGKALAVFQDHYETLSNPQKFLTLKIGVEEITMDQVMEAYEFLTEVDKSVLAIWKQKKYAGI